MKNRSIGWTVAVATCLAVAAIFAMYVGGYFVLGTRFDFFCYTTSPHLVYRGYQHAWLIQIYEPIGNIEEAITGSQVKIGSMDVDEGLRGLMPPPPRDAVTR